MVRNSTSKKSEGKKDIMTQFPEAFTDQCPFDGEEIDLFIDDTTQRLQGISPERDNWHSSENKFARTFGNSTSSSSSSSDSATKSGAKFKGQTFRQFIEEFKRPIEETIATSKKGRAYVMCFDKPPKPQPIDPEATSDVPSLPSSILAKAQEQRKRRKGIERYGVKRFKTFLKTNNMLDTQKKMMFTSATFTDWPLEQSRMQIASEDDRLNFAPVKTLESNLFRMRTWNDKTEIFLWFLENDQKYELTIDPVDFLRACQTQSPRHITLKSNEYKVIKYELPDFATCLDLDKVLPRRWDEIMTYQKGARGLLIKFICFHLFHKNGAMRLALGSHSKVIVDGHRLDESSLLTMGFEKKDIPSDHLYCPISVSFSNQPGVVSRDLKFEHDLRNELCESDFTSFFMISKLAKRAAVIQSTDTDMLVYSLIYTWRLLKPLLEQDANAIERSLRLEDEPLSTPSPLLPEILIYRKKNSADQVKRTAEGQFKVKEEEWTRVMTLYHAINTHKKLRKLEIMAVPWLAATMIMGGNDYVNGFYYVPPRHFISAALEYSHFFRPTPILRWREDINEFAVTYDNYLKFLSLVYATSFKTNFGKDPVPPLNVFNKPIWEIINVIQSKQKDKRRHFPSMEDCKLSYNQFMYALSMTSSLGQPKLEEKNLLHYGYSTNDNSSVLTYENTVRMCIGGIGQDEEDEDEE